MAKLTKRAKMIQEKVTPGKLYPIEEALDLLRELSAVKFKESVDVSINLGVDPRKSDQVVRGSTVLPNGTAKSVRVAVFTQGANADAAKEAGADIVGMEDLAEDVKKGNMDFDVVIASPDAMRVVGALGQILGPRGLMPNPKVGTVAQDVATAVKNGKLKENLEALLADLQKAKPSAAKGVYLKKISVTTTMGPGLQVDQASLGAM